MLETTRDAILDSLFSILNSRRNQESSRESRLATDCQLTFERYCTHYFPQARTLQKLAEKLQWAFQVIHTMLAVDC